MKPTYKRSWSGETMKLEQPVRPATHLFAVRIWLEPLSETQAEWRGKIEYVLTGEWHYFRDWSTLIAHLKAMVSADRTTG
jgi:hypothetical protein